MIAGWLLVTYWNFNSEFSVAFLCRVRREFIQIKTLWNSESELFSLLGFHRGETMHSRTEINEERYARLTKGFSKILLKNVRILNEHSGIIAGMSGSASNWLWMSGNSNCKCWEWQAFSDQLSGGLRDTISIDPRRQTVSAISNSGSEFENEVWISNSLWNLSKFKMRIFIFWIMGAKEQTEERDGETDTFSGFEFIWYPRWGFLIHSLLSGSHCPVVQKMQTILAANCCLWGWVAWTTQNLNGKFLLEIFWELKDLPIRWSQRESI